MNLSGPSITIQHWLIYTNLQLTMGWKTLRNCVHPGSEALSSMRCEICDLGLIEYEQAWKLQDKYAAEIAAGTRGPALFLLEHPHVYTFGRKGHAGNLLWDDQHLKERGVTVHWVDRGGDVTYHGPGQLVGYPLIPLGSHECEEQGLQTLQQDPETSASVQNSGGGLCRLCPQVGEITRGGIGTARTCSRPDYRD